MSAVPFKANAARRHCIPRQRQWEELLPDPQGRWPDDASDALRTTKLVLGHDEAPPHTRERPSPSTVPR
jgi:hypothetical protein